MGLGLGLGLGLGFGFGFGLGYGVGHLREGQAVGHALDEPLARRGGEAAVGRELEVEALLLEEVVHQQQHLDDELVLPGDRWWADGGQMVEVVGR